MGGGGFVVLIARFIYYEVAVGRHYRHAKEGEEEGERRVTDEIRILVCHMYESGPDENPN